ncbi:MAG: hypothetical protein ACI9KE_004754 [Polyangiales bacterium]|jgi:hypothetical protein
MRPRFRPPLTNTATREVRRADFNRAEYRSEEHVVDSCSVADFVKLGAFWGGFFGLLFAPAFFCIPGVGVFLSGGALGSVLLGMLEGGMLGAVVGSGATALGAHLASIRACERAFRPSPF